MVMITKRKEGSHYYLISVIAAVISALVYGYINNYFSELVVVHTSYGAVKGFAATSREGQKFYQFNAIPYARPPVGHLRFKPPVSVEPWIDSIDGTRMTPICAQFDMLMNSFRGQEDCLYLNIFTRHDPGKELKKPLPVMVFIHGGLFMFGGSWEFYGGRYFMDEEVILVVINYRLGMLGFLNTGDEAVSGNMGLKDQLEALKFLKKIIPDFGGDPNSILLFGESAGGASVHYHMLSTQSKGLFQRAISQSGSAFCPWAFQRSPREQSMRLGNQVGCPTNSSEVLVECLTSLDVWDLISSHKNLVDIFMDPLDLYGPSVENVTSEVAKASAFLQEYPHKLAADGMTHSVPWIAGVNSHEGCFRSAWFVGQKKLLDKLNADWDGLSSAAFYLFQNDSKTLDSLRKHHFGDVEEITTSQNDYQSLTNLIGDRLFTIPVRDAALLHAKRHVGNKNVSTYLYYLSQKGDLISFGDLLAVYNPETPVPWILEIIFLFMERVFTKYFSRPTFDYGACHADDVLQLFPPNPKLASLLDFSVGHPHYQLSRNMVKAWTKFARDGEPGSFDNTPWEKLSLNKNSKYLHLNAEKAEMIDEPFKSRLSFWHQLKLPRNLNPDHESQYNYDVLK